MHDLAFQIIAMIIGGAVLGIGGFILVLLWNLRAEWILDHAWQKTAQSQLVAFGDRFDKHGKQFEEMMLKLNGLDGRLTNLEHPIYPLRRQKPKIKNGEH